MTRHFRLLATGFVLVAAAASLFPVVSSAERPPSQVVLEVGAAVPTGNLGDDFYDTELGLGIKSGLELGFRWRFFLNDQWSLAPAFHFLNYKDFKSVTPEGDDFRIKPTSFRYTLEVMWMPGERDSSIRPFAALSAGLFRNRLEAFHKTYDKPFDSSVNTFGAMIRAGVKLGSFELCALYGQNEFDTWDFFKTGQAETYDWSHWGVRAGWIVPFGAEDD
jgi:hypothetical protein